MTQIWQGETVIPVTQIEAGPCTVIQLKNTDKDGYAAVQVGYGKRRASLITKPLRGHFKNLGDFRFVREFRLPASEASSELKAGDTISVKTFKPGDTLTITGTSKGKGFQGVVKRHGFHGQDATHGNKDQLRMSGSIGAGGVQHVFKGMRMGGRMGGDKVTLHDVQIVSVDEATNTIFIKGAIPGARNGLVLLSGNGELVLGLPEEKIEEPVVTEETVNSEEGSEVSNEPVEVVESTSEAIAEPAEVEVETPVVEVKESEGPVVETPDAPAEAVEETAKADTVAASEEVAVAENETPSNT